MDVDANSKEKMGKGVDATYKKGNHFVQQCFPYSSRNKSSSHWFLPSALEEAAVRFRELQAEKELRQLQEDKKNDRKPPPYKHIKVKQKTCDVYDIFPLFFWGFFKNTVYGLVVDGLFQRRDVYLSSYVCNLCRWIDL